MLQIRVDVSFKCEVCIHRRPTHVPIDLWAPLWNTTLIQDTSVNQSENLEKGEKNISLRKYHEYEQNSSYCISLAVMPQTKIPVEEVSLHIVTLILHSVVTTKKSQLLITEAETASIAHPHFSEWFWIAILSVVTCFSLVWACVFLSPALGIVLSSSEILSRIGGVEIFVWQALGCCLSTPCQ